MKGAVFMTRKSGLMVAVLLISMAFVPVGASAQTLPVTGTGTTTCTGAWTGKLHFSPPLKTAGTAHSEEVSIEARAKPCAGGTPPPTKGKIVGKGIISGAGANDCTTTMTFNTPGFYEGITWTPVVVGTRLDFPTLTWAPGAGASTGHLVISGGPVTTAGSYAITTATQSLTTLLTTAAILADCGSAAGVSALSIATPESTGTY
jgi:hypothetical protein